MKRHLFIHLVIASLVFLSFANLAHAILAGKVTLVEGRVDVLKPGKNVAVPVKQGAPVDVGDIYRAKSDGRAEITFINGNIIKLASKTRAEIKEGMFEGDKSSNVIKLHRGRVQAISGQDFIKKAAAFAEGNKFEVHTPNAVAGIRGSNMIVSFLRGITGTLFVTGRGYQFNPNDPQRRLVNITGGTISFVTTNTGSPSPARRATTNEITVQVNAVTTVEQSGEGGGSQQSGQTTGQSTDTGSGTSGTSGDTGTSTDTTTSSDTTASSSGATTTTTAGTFTADSTVITTSASTTTSAFTSTSSVPTVTPQTIITPPPPEPTQETTTTNLTGTIENGAFYSVTDGISSAHGSITGTLSATLTDDSGTLAISGDLSGHEDYKLWSTKLEGTTDQSGGFYAKAVGTWTSWDGLVGGFYIEGNKLSMLKSTLSGTNTDSTFTGEGTLTKEYKGTTTVTAAQLYDGSPYINVNNNITGFIGKDIQGSVSIESLNLTDQNWGVWGGMASGTYITQPGDNWAAAIGGKTVETIATALNWQTPQGLSQAPDVTVTGNTIEMGVTTKTSSSQHSSLHGASALLSSKAIGYTVTFNYDLSTNDAYSMTGSGNKGWYDSFSVSLSKDKYWTLSLSDPLKDDLNLNVGFIWGGNSYGDGLETNQGTKTVYIPGVPIFKDTVSSNDVYLNVYLDTKTLPNADTSYPSWGSITIQEIKAVTDFWYGTLTGTKWSDGKLIGTMSVDYINTEEWGTAVGDVLGTYNNDTLTWQAGLAGPWEVKSLKFISNFSNGLFSTKNAREGYLTGLFAGATALWSGSDIPVIFIGDYMPDTTGTGPFVWHAKSTSTTNIWSYNYNDYTYTTYDGGAYRGFFTGTEVGKSMTGNFISLYIDPDGNAGILKGSLTGSTAYPDVDMFKMTGTINPAIMVSNIGISAANLDSNMSSYTMSLTNPSSGSFGGSGSINISTGRGSLTGKYITGQTGWGIEQILAYGTYSGTPGNTWDLYGFAYKKDSNNNYEYWADRRMYGYDWSANKIGANSYGNWFDLASDPKTGISVGDLAGTFDPNTLTWNSAMTGLYLETSKFLEMVVDAAGQTKLQNLNIPCVEVGMVNMSGSVNSMTVNMNDVKFFSTTSSEAPRLWATGNVAGSYTQTPSTSTVVALSGGGLNANFNVKTWDTSAAKWGATVTDGTGSITGGGANVQNIKFSGTAAGTMTPGAGASGTFSGTAAGTAK